MRPKTGLEMMGMKLWMAPTMLRILPISSGATCFEIMHLRKSQFSTSEDSHHSEIIISYSSTVMYSSYTHMLKATFAVMPILGKYGGFFNLIIVKEVASRKATHAPT